MIITGRYSFNNGENVIQDQKPQLLQEVEDVIRQIDAESCRLKNPIGRERDKLRRIGEQKFYSPIHINALFDYYFLQRNWLLKPRIKTNDSRRQGFREMDAIKDCLGVEIQLGKYAFLTYDIVAKMVIFKKHHVIDLGIEVCPMASMLPHMSSGIGAFEQVVWDLKHRGAYPEFDVPVLVLGIESERVQSHPIGSNTLPLFQDDLQPIIVTNRHRVLDEKIRRRVRETGIVIP